MLSPEQLDVVDRIINETPIATDWNRTGDESQEVDDAKGTLRDAARRVREYLTPLNQGDGF